MTKTAEAEIRLGFLNGIEMKLKKTIKWAAIVAVCVAALVYTVAYYLKPDGGGVTVYYFNVGQGDAALAVSGDTVILFDAGTNESEARLIAYIERLGIKEIDCMVLSHPHDDHIGGADGVIREFDVLSVLMPPRASEERCYHELMDAISDEDCRLINALGGESIAFGELTVTALISDAVFGDENLDSLVSRLDFGETSFLFTGDCEGEAETALTEKYKDAVDCDVLKVGHHGSKGATSAEFLAAVTPDIAVISCGKDNEYGHPHVSVLDRLTSAGAVIFRTDEGGTVTVVSDGVNVSVEE